MGGEVAMTGAAVETLEQVAYVAAEATVVVSMASAFGWRTRTPALEIDAIKRELRGLKLVRKIVRFEPRLPESKRRMRKHLRRFESWMRAELRRVKGYHRRAENKLPPGRKRVA